MDVNGIGAIVTGGASGLGRATAESLIGSGAKVTIFDINEEVGTAAAAEMGCVFAKVDVTSEEDVIAGLNKGAAENGLESRILVNCAGINIPGKTVSRGEALDLAKYAKVIEVNLIGTFNCIRLATQRMVGLDPLEDGERGVVVNTASVAAFDGQVGQAAYAASKGGIVGMTLPIARDLSRDGVRCNTIAPGLFLTPMMMALPEESRKSLGESVPFPSRLGTPEEYAKTVRFICDNVMVNGETIRLDGAIRLPPK